MGALGVIILASLTNAPLKNVVPVTAAVALLTASYRFLLTWRNLLALLIVVILFIPIRRYALPGNLPFQLEPYRLLAFLIVGGWVTSLLVDPRVHWRRSGLERPIGLLSLAIVASVMANLARVQSVSSYSIKQLSFFASFLLVFYLIVSVVRTQATLDYLVRWLVGGGAVVAFFTILEARTHYNVFNHLSKVLPILREQAVATAGQDGRGDRAYASGQHPISLGAALVLCGPVTVALSLAECGFSLHLRDLAVCFIQPAP